MKTKILLTAFAFSLSVVVFAQEKITLEKRITNYSVKIDSIVTSEKEKMNLELNAVEKKFNDGKISESIMNVERNKISAKYSESINVKINAEKDDLDEITKASAMNSVMGKEEVYFVNANNSLISASFKEKKKHPKQLLNTIKLESTLNYSNLTQNNSSLNIFEKTDFIKSGNYTSGNGALKFEHQLGKLRSPIFVNYGITYREDAYKLNDSKIAVQNNNRLQFMDFTAGNLKYSFVKAKYIEIPVGLKFVLNPKYLDFEGDQYLDMTKKQFIVGLGFYGGIKIDSGIRYNYSNDVSKRNVFTQKIENGLNDFVFGTKLTVGYGGINIFLKKDLTPVFNNDASISNKYGLQLGIELANIIF